MTTTTAPALLTIPEAAASLRVSERTIKRLVASGDLESVVLGDRARRFHPDAIAAYLTTRRSTPAPATDDEHALADQPADDPLQRSSRSPRRRALRAV